jgi:NAD(P)-dependent dehydrogenase (short-subunit alcohol dehydrogenase family)
MSLPVHPGRPTRSLKGKVAIVTGAGSQGDGIGNGRAIALLLAEDGAKVVCVDREEALAQRTAHMVLLEGQEATAVRADVTLEQDCAGIVDAALSKYGRVDMLVNNVGVMGPRGTAVEVDADAWATGLQANVTSMMLMAKYAVPAMARNEPGDGGIRGSIVNLGSVAGLQGGTPSLLYPTSKGAVVNMTRAMAAHHAGDGIRVNCVCPGEISPFCGCMLLLDADSGVWSGVCRHALHPHGV